MKALLLPLLAAGALSCRASTVILSGVLHDAEQGIVGGYGPGQGTFSMQLEGSTLTFHVTTSGHPDLLLAAPSLRLALSGGELRLSFSTAASIIGGGCFFYSLYTPLSVRWDGSGIPPTLPLVRPLPIVDCDNIILAATYGGAFTLGDDQITEFRRAGFGVSFFASYTPDFGGIPTESLRITRTGWTDPEFFTVPIPEPTTAALACAALVAYGGRRSRKPNLKDSFNRVAH